MVMAYNPTVAAALREYRRQRGGASLPHFQSPISYQRGHGLGGLLRSLFRSVVPLFKKPIVRQGLKSLGKAAATAVLEAGQKALSQDNEGSFGSALKASSQRQARELIRQAQGSMAGQGPVKRRKRVSLKVSAAREGRVKKRRDIFG